MNYSDHDIKRIIVSVDAGGFNLSTLEATVLLASYLQADLCGLFIEDTDLLQLANLPFTREITLHTGMSRDLNSSSIESNLMAMAAHMRQTLEALTKISNVGCTFRTVRGPRLESVIKESEEYQLALMLPKKRLTEYRRDVTVTANNRPIVLFYDDSLQARRALQVIRSLSNDVNVKHLLIMATTQAADIEIAKQLPASQYHLSIQHVSEYNIRDVINLLKSHSPGMVILPLEDILLKQGREVRKLLDVLACPLVLVR